MRSTPVESLFLDTWGWLALVDAKDPAHADAVSERRRCSAPGRLVTTDYVLDETFTRLYSRCSFAIARQFSDAVLSAEKTTLLGIERITPERFAVAYRWRARYRDKAAISFTDLTSFVVMKELGIREVLTADMHFTQAHLGFRRVP
jgi:uncharacterized protein